MPHIYVLGEALMDCVAQPNGDLRPLIGGSPYNFARAAALRGARVGYLNPLSTDLFGDAMRLQLAQDGVQVLSPPSRLPSSLAVVQIRDGQPSYAHYREGVADRDFEVNPIQGILRQADPGILHTGSLMLIPPQHDKVISIVQAAKSMGWTVSVDVNMRPKMAADLTQYVAAVKRLAGMADWLKASDEDLELLGFATPSSPTRADAPRIAQHFTAQGVIRLALTFGANGAWLVVDGKTAEQDVRQVTVIDTVGAGDTFWGNCVADWAIQATGAAQRVETTLNQAMQTAAINCTRPGCQPPRFTEVLRNN